MLNRTFKIFFCGFLPSLKVFIEIQNKHITIKTMASPMFQVSKLSIKIKFENKELITKC